MSQDKSSPQIRTASMPDDLVLSDGSYFGEARLGLGIGWGSAAFIAVLLKLIRADINWSYMVLPLGALGLFWFVWVSFHALLGLLHRWGDKRAIKRLFDNEIWEQWQFQADAWSDIVSGEYRKMLPEEGPGAYTGALFSGGLGLLVAAALAAAGKYAIKAEEAMPIIYVCAAAVMAGLTAVGLYQPIRDRRRARRYRKRALRVSAPRVWFGAEGVYHEALGYTSLKDLQEVRDHTRKLKAVTFTVRTVTVFGSSGHFGRSSTLVPVSFDVPAGHEKQAAQLVHRYRLKLPA